MSIAAAPRRTRKTKAVAVESAGKESLAKLAPVIIGMMQMAGSVVSDQADMTGLEQTLIITGLESLPSEQMEKALKIMGPLSLVAGSGMYFIRVMTHRRPPPAPVKRDPPPNPHTNPPTNGASIVTEQPVTGGIPTGGDMPLANPFVSSIPINTNGTSH